MLVREVSELLRSIDSPSISNPNENKSESLLVWPVIVVFYLCSGRHSYTHAIASLIEDWRGKVEEKARDGFRSLSASRMR
ncbi:hypothetical protein RND81_13G068800 [Saponaria officinalis]|uniref:Uncharacterized protein n=1 Tax=Saponaria officinalis TaxID=3572 RepID=A0AAW1GUM2_SAPOF